MHDPPSKTMRIQHELSGLGLKAYLRHTASNQPRPAVVNLVHVLGQLTLEITQYSSFCLSFHLISLAVYYLFRHAISLLQSGSSYIERTSTPTYLNKHTQYTDYHLCTSGIGLRSART